MLSPFMRSLISRAKTQSVSGALRIPAARTVSPILARYQSSSSSSLRSSSSTPVASLSSSSPAVGTPRKQPPKPRKAAREESKPIRIHPSPTRSSLKHIFSFSTAVKYDLDRLAASLPPGAQAVSTGESEYCWRVPLNTSSNLNIGSDGTGEIWILRNGSFVTWGLERDQALNWWRKLSKPAGFEVGPYEVVEDESLEFYIDPAEPNTRLQGDIIILSSKHSSAPNESTLLTRYTFSEAISRSSQLSVIEGQLLNLLNKVQFVPQYLATQGKGPYKRKEVIKLLGELLVVRQAVNLQGVGDTPELFWDAPPILEEHFKRVVRALEVNQRVEELNHKISHAQELHGTLKDLLTEQSTHDMEVIIIALIAVEVVLAFWSHWDELMDALGIEREKRV
ncbi:Uncharacterized conserved protein [Phaffia rhodozyma]|uniref:Uncharacterized conserved protein n=1 Tax=Phaffia rhodozyma TaxID=264483 RepID=A0A0F7SLT3_PHARH|nr:Uncharacterized conserved protein [Phaffia rhodozyma]